MEGLLARLGAKLARQQRATHEEGVAQEVERRLEHVRPALGALVAGGRPLPLEVLRSNVAFHAARVPEPQLPAVDWRRAQ